jgi:hypothetical protein
MIVEAADFGFLAVIAMAENQPSGFTKSIVILGATPDVNVTVSSAISSGILLGEIRCSSFVFSFGD